MPLLSAKVDISGPMLASRDLREKQIPFTIARALTMTAMQGRDEMRGKEGQVFKLRNDWTVSRTLVTPAKISGAGSKLVAEVYTDTSNLKTGAGDYLEKQDEGGEKIPVNGRSHIAVPTRYLRQMAPGIIPDELRPRNLLGAIAGRYTAHTRKGRLALKTQTRVLGMVFFVATLKSGTLAILGRQWTEQEAYPFYVLVPEAHVKAALHAFEMIDGIVQSNFEQNFSQAATEVIANDLLRGSGVQVKL